jgi:tRNA A-37 threonylcarbamoyl transferase component Bud32
MINKNLKNSGQSGCKLIFYSKNDRSIVRKLSTNSKNSARLKLEFQKTRGFNYPSIHTPNIYKIGKISNCFYYDMQYISGTTLDQFLLNEDKVLGKNFLIKILDFISNCKKKSFSDKNISHKFKQKIKILKNKNKNKIAGKFLQNLNNVNWHEVRSSASHGDLTMDNVLIDSKKKLFFLDLSKNFIDSYMLDVSKIMFDFFVGWSFNKNDINYQSDINKIQIVDFFKKFLFKNITDIIDENEKKLLKKLMILDLLRVMPYTENDRMNLLLLNNFTKIEKKFK